MLVDRVHAELPDCRIVFLAVKPSPDRWHLSPEMRKTNRLLARLCAEDDRLTYVDIATPMLDETGNPKPGIFKADELHMNREGYLLWRDTLRPALIP